MIPLSIENQKSIMQRQTPQASRNPNLVLVLVSLVVPIVGLILGVIFVSRTADDDKATGRNCLIASLTSITIGIALTVLLFAGVFTHSSRHTSNDFSPEAMQAKRRQIEDAMKPPADLPPMVLIDKTVSTKKVVSLKHSSRYVPQADALGSYNGVAVQAYFREPLNSETLIETIKQKPAVALMPFHLLIENNRNDSIIIDAKDIKLRMTSTYETSAWGGEVVLDSLKHEPSMISIGDHDVSMDGVSVATVQPGDFVTVDVTFLMQSANVEKKKALKACDYLSIGISSLGKFVVRAEF